MQYFEIGAGFVLTSLPASYRLSVLNVKIPVAQHSSSSSPEHSLSCVTTPLPYDHVLLARQLQRAQSRVAVNLALGSVPQLKFPLGKPQANLIN